jgi:hypothetical protein
MCAIQHVHNEQPIPLFTSDSRRSNGFQLQTQTVATIATPVQKVSVKLPGKKIIMKIKYSNSKPSHYLLNLVTQNVLDQLAEGLITRHLLLFGLLLFLTFLQCQPFLGAADQLLPIIIFQLQAKDPMSATSAGAELSKLGNEKLQSKDRSWDPTITRRPVNKPRYLPAAHSTHRLDPP